MADMLVKLYHITPDHALIARLAQQQITIKRVLAPDALRVIRFIETSAEAHWPQEAKERWMAECAASMSNHPPTCFVAVQQRTIIGFACYNATANGYVGPMGVLREAQGNGVGKALLITSLLAMWDEGYGYAIIGWAARSAMEFYAKTVQAQVIEDSSPGIYRRLIDG
ncbi:GNAT family N-acetyltransferase [Candidatus Chloroploca sp. M-50]|uniref:GNAT family N-acetyltransferase n=1 Tax=Candidatus Chloroploca mongolica TaxID=2528176 RepID=A0ABS4D3X8_9CHLR|nr:GNAT family N-acetyltransferase [Candidatus Chloroploca mongolica]MBP1464146.1 GNAT family N-acetyltransferase [Candidatus Chloroploca mongolica]